MEIRQLVTFHKVAAKLSFTKAAAELNYAQSSVTGQIKVLEQSLGVELFERGPGQVRLTASGEQLLPYVEQILALVKEVRELNTRGRAPSGTLTVGTTESLTSYWMPGVLEFFYRRFPGLHVMLQCSSSAETLEALTQDAIDLGFLLGAKIEHPGVHTEVFGSEPLTMVAGPAHRLVSAGPLGMADLRRVPVLLPEAQGYRELFEAAVKRDIDPVRVVGFGTVESTKRGVAAGLGVGLLPRMAVADEIAAGLLVALDWQPSFEVFTQLVWRRGRRLSQEMRLFIDRIMEFMIVEPRAATG